MIGLVYNYSPACRNLYTVYTLYTVWLHLIYSLLQRIQGLHSLPQSATLYTGYHLDCTRFRRSSSLLIPFMER